MRSETLKPLLLQAAREHGIDTVCGEQWGLVAEFLSAKLDAEDEVRKKRANIQLVRASLLKQQQALSEEEKLLQEQCPHLCVGDPSGSEDGEHVWYICQTCGAEVAL